jgi:sulfate permease, SulP family
VSGNISKPRRNYLLFNGILPYEKKNISSDIFAGITLAALSISVMMGYTKIIGTPIITGLYTILIPMAAFAIFGSSRMLVVCGDSATAAIVASSFATLSIVVYSPHYLALAGTVALLVGGMLIIARLFRLGFLADFLSRTVLIGFLSGVGIQVALSQLHGMLGFEVPHAGMTEQIKETFLHFSEINKYAVFISLGVIVVILGFGRFAPKIPGAFIAIIVSIAASMIFHGENLGIRLVGEVPQGLPKIGLPDISWKEAVSLLPVAFSCLIVIIAQSDATSRSYAIKYKQKLDLNRDLIGLFMANISAGMTGTFVVNGSPTQTAILDNAGGRSQVSQLVSASVVLLVLLYLTKPLGFLPDAVLSAIVFHIGIKLVNYKGLSDIYKKARYEFALAIITALVVIFIGVEVGILLAIILSLLMHVYYNYKPQTGIVVHDKEDHWHIIETKPDVMIEPGLLIYWFGSDLFYANSSHFSEEINNLIDNPDTPLKWLIIDCTTIVNIDYSSAMVLLEIIHMLKKKDIQLGLVRLGGTTKEQLIHLGVYELIDQDMIFNSRKKCLSAFHLWNK